LVVSIVIIREPASRGHGAGIGRWGSVRAALVRAVEASIVKPNRGRRKLGRGKKEKGVMVF
jgi:hypothetical protein